MEEEEDEDEEGREMEVVYGDGEQCGGVDEGAFGEGESQPVSTIVSICDLMRMAEQIKSREILESYTTTMRPCSYYLYNKTKVSCWIMGRS